MTFYVTTTSKHSRVYEIEAEDEWSLFAIWDELGLKGAEHKGVFYKNPDHGNVKDKTIVKINERRTT